MNLPQLHKELVMSRQAVVEGCEPRATSQGQSAPAPETRPTDGPDECHDVFLYADEVFESDARRAAAVLREAGYSCRLPWDGGARWPRDVVKEYLALDWESPEKARDYGVLEAWKMECLLSIRYARCLVVLGPLDADWAVLAGFAQGIGVRVILCALPDDCGFSEPPTLGFDWPVATNHETLLGLVAKFTRSPLISVGQGDSRVDWPADWGKI
jgi:hypothetical protein